MADDAVDTDLLLLKVLAITSAPTTRLLGYVLRQQRAGRPLSLAWVRVLFARAA
jgi:hypothetical protein